MQISPLYRSAVRQFGLRLALVRPDQWTRPTPAEGWTVAQVVHHVIAGQLDVPLVLAGEALEPADADADADDARLGGTGDLRGRWDAASRAAVDALAVAEPDAAVTDRDGATITALDFGRRMGIELTVHAWDVGRAIGESDGSVGQFPNDLVAATLRWAQDSATWRRGAQEIGGAYAPPIPVPGCTDDLIELLALTGRNRWWRPAPG